MRNDRYAAEATGVSKTLGRKPKGKVVFHGTVPQTDGDTIYVPPLPLGGEMTEAEVDIHRGYIDHEDAHIRQSDIAVLKQAQREDPSGTLTVALDALEDLRVERGYIALYPGAKDTLGASYRKTAELIADQPFAMLKASGQLLPLAAALLGRKRYGIESEHAAAVLDKIDTETLVLAERFVKQALDCESSADVLKVARLMAKEMPERKGKGKGKGEGEGDKGEGGDTDMPSAEGEGEEEGEESEMDGPGKAASIFDAARKESLPNSHMPAGGTKRTGRNDYLVWTTEYDRVFHRRDNGNAYSRKMASGSLSLWADFYSRMSGKIGVISRRMERALLANRQREWTGGATVGRLDSKRLVAAAQGVERVFKTRSATPEIDTAVSILIDLSGSMASKVDLARDVTALLSIVLERIGCAVHVVGFDNTFRTLDAAGSMVSLASRYTKFMEEGRRAAIRTTGFGFARYEAMRLFVFKEWTDTVAAARGSLMAISDFVGENNADPDAIVWAALDLNKRYEKRKLLIVVSDGQPCCVGDNPVALQSYTKEVVRSAMKMGIETFGIGLMTDSVKDYYPNYVTTKNLTEFAETTFVKVAEIVGKRDMHLTAAVE
jgi:hypothetical protein